MLNMERMNTLRRIKEEYEDIRNPNVNLGITVGIPDPDNIFNWRFTIIGPPDTLYKGGLFYLNLNFPDNYPNSPPKVKFITPIYHVNVKSRRNNMINADDIGIPDLSILQNWRPEYKVKDVLISLYSLFYMNKDYSNYSLEMSDELRVNKPLYERKIKYFTQKYAYPRGYIESQNWDFTYSQ